MTPKAGDRRQARLRLAAWQYRSFYSFAVDNGRGGAPYKSELNYYGTVRGKLGYSFGRLMAYGTAGYAYGELEVKNTGTGASASEMLGGWPTVAASNTSGTGI